jgi:hypothetical protein
MKASDRKAARAAYKEQKVVAGIYCVRSSASGEVWVGETRNLGKVQNRIWFMLRHGGHPSPSVQRAWTAHGADAFTLEELEWMEHEELVYVLDAQLKQRVQHWRAKLNAQPIL